MNLRGHAFRTRLATVQARVGPLELAIALGTALAAVAGTIGADARWLAALGRVILDRGGIPDGVPYASAPSAGWHNVPVLAELILHGLTTAAGDRGLLAAQVVAVAVGLAVVALDMLREDADEMGGALVLLAVVVGGLLPLVIIRSQLFSLLLFPVLVGLLRAEARAPSARIWLLPLLLALWSNLHGAVLVGLAVASVYLALAQRDPLVGATVFVASVLAVCATPALDHTPDYYLGLVRNDAARRGLGLWAPLSFTSGFDLLLVAAAIALVVLALRARPAVWEIVVLAGLAVLTVRTARSGIWLLFFAASPAARSLRLGHARRSRLLATASAIAAALLVLGLARGPISTGAGKPLLHEALRRAAGTPILADGVAAEQVALAGGRVWMSNPLDAFDHHDQRVYLDWLEGRPAGDAALRHAPRVVIVGRDSPAAKRLRHGTVFRPAGHDGSVILYVRRP